MKTDKQLKHDVTAELAWDPAVDAVRIGVEVQGGVVTLTGQVRSLTEKWQAEQAAQRVAGVQGLVVEMQVNLPGMNERADADIASSVQATLESLSDLPGDSIQFIVEQGWVTLCGAVPWNYQRLRAVESVRGLRGVTGLTDSIGLKPGAPIGDIQSDIEAALSRRSDASKQHITVSVDRGQVTLSGRVMSLWDRERTREIAWSAAGVHHVQDDLKIAW